MRKILNCICGNVGFFVCAGQFSCEPEQEQCEFCYTELDSVFNHLMNKDKEIADLKVNSNLRESAYKTHIESLEAQLADSIPKVEVLKILAKEQYFFEDSPRAYVPVENFESLLSNQPINQESDS